MSQPPSNVPLPPAAYHSADNPFQSTQFPAQWPSSQSEGSSTGGTEVGGGGGGGGGSGGGSGDGGRGGDVESQSGGGNGASTARTANETASAPRIRRRNRMITSCLECRRRKLKCDRLHPCSNCSKFSRDCLFLAPAMGPDARRKLTELKDKMGSLERVLEQDAAAHQALHQDGSQFDGDDRVDSNALVSLLESSTEAQAQVPEDEKNLNPTPLAVQDAAYEDGSDDDTVDLGFKLGKMRMTDRVGGFFRPKIADEVCS